MSEADNSLIYEVLKSLQAGQTDVKNDLRDIKGRLASIESYIATMHGDSTRQTVRLDLLEQRLERLETRLNLKDG